MCLHEDISQQIGLDNGYALLVMPFLSGESFYFLFDSFTSLFPLFFLSETLPSWLWETYVVPLLLIFVLKNISHLGHLLKIWFLGDSLSLSWRTIFEFFHVDFLWLFLFHSISFLLFLIRHNIFLIVII